MSWLSKKWIFS